MATINQLNIGGSLYDIEGTDPTKLPLDGGAMTGSITSGMGGTNYIKGRDNALLKIASVPSNKYMAVLSMKVATGSWEIGHYNNGDNATNDTLQLIYSQDANYANNTNSVSYYGVKNNGALINMICGPNSQIASWTSNTTWTATQNCIIMGSHYNGQVKLNDVIIYPANSNAKNFFLLVKKGDVVVMNGLNSTYVARAYSIG